MSGRVCAAALALVIAAPMAAAAQTAHITGTITYRERMALSPNAVVDIRLDDVTRPGAMDPIIASTRLDHPGQVAQFTVDLRGDGGAILTEELGEQLPDRRRLGHTPLSLALDADQMDLDFRHVHSSGTATSRFAGQHRWYPLRRHALTAYPQARRT